MKILKVFARSYIPTSQLGATIVFYERVLDEKCSIRIPLPEIGIEVAGVGNISLVAGSEHSLEPFRQIRAEFSSIPLPISRRASKGWAPRSYCHLRPGRTAGS